MRASASQDWLDDRKDETMSQFDSPKMEITSDFPAQRALPYATARLLSGLVRCACCGGSLSVVKDDDRTRYSMLQNSRGMAPSITSSTSIDALRRVAP